MNEGNETSEELPDRIYYWPLILTEVAEDCKNRKQPVWCVRIQTEQKSTENEWNEGGAHLFKQGDWKTSTLTFLEENIGKVEYNREILRGSKGLAETDWKAQFEKSNSPIFIFNEGNIKLSIGAYDLSAAARLLDNGFHPNGLPHDKYERRLYNKEDFLKHFQRCWAVSLVNNNHYCKIENMQQVPNDLSTQFARMERIYDSYMGWPIPSVYLTKWQDEIRFGLKEEQYFRYYANEKGQDDNFVTLYDKCVWIYPDRHLNRLHVNFGGPDHNSCPRPFVEEKTIVLAPREARRIVYEKLAQLSEGREIFMRGSIYNRKELKRVVNRSKRHLGL